MQMDVPCKVRSKFACFDLLKRLPLLLPGSNQFPFHQLWTFHLLFSPHMIPELSLLYQPNRTMMRRSILAVFLLLWDQKCCQMIQY
jgi:hypothetical protein